MRGRDRGRSGAVPGRAGRAACALAVLCAASALNVPPVAGHALLHRVLEGDSVVRIQFRFPDGDRPLFESYRVMAPDDDQPFQTGRVNALGEVSFLPHRPGIWRVTVTTEDGHGTEARVRVDTEGLGTETQGSEGLSRWERVASGVGYVLGVFGILALWRGGRARRTSA